MITIKLLLKLLNILNKDATPRAIAGGMCLGAIAGITPTASLHNLLVLVVVMMIQVNFSAALLAMAVFKLFSYAFDPLFNRIGLALLSHDGLKGLWTALYNTPGVPWTRFNNTLTLGSLVAALLLFVPLYFALVWAVTKYREQVLARVQKWKVMQILKASKLYGLYASYSGE